MTPKTKPKAAARAVGRDSSALERRWALVLLGVGAAAFLWRALYLRRLLASPLGGSLTEDSATYWEWAGLLLAHGPVGTQPFFLGPLYPYVLAVLRMAGGASIPFVLWAQMLWGAAAAVLLADAARRLTRPSIGLAVGLLVALYEMAVFFDGLVLMESLLFFLEALLLWWVVRTSCNGVRARVWAVTGILIGLLAEGRALSALLLAPAALFAWECGPRPRWVLRCATLVLGFGLIALPVALRNFTLAREWIPFTYNFGFNLYIGNNPSATGGHMPTTGTHESRGLDQNLEGGGAASDGREYLLKVEGVRLGPNASSRHWQSKAVSHMRAHPAETARLAGRKLKMMWNRREYPQIENADEYRAVAGPLGLPVVGSFAVLGMLGIAGLFFAWRAGPRERFMLGYAVVLTAGILPFFVVDRYRHHLIPAVALLAALAIARAIAARTSRRDLLRVIAALGVGAVVVHLPAPELGRGRYQWALAADMGSRWLEQGRPDRAVVELERAVTALDRETESSTTALERGALYHNYALALTRTGRAGEALAWLERAARTAPGNARIARTLADARRLAGNTAAAESLERRLPQMVGGDARLFGLRGLQAARSGDLEGAAGLFEQAVQMDSRLHDSWVGLIRARIELQQFAAADTALRGAQAAGLPRPTVDAYGALLAAIGGDATAAERSLARIPASAMADSSVLEVVTMTKRLLAR